MPGQLHRDGARHARQFEVSRGGASEVVQDAPRDGRPFSGGYGSASEEREKVSLGWDAGGCARSWPLLRSVQDTDHVNQAATDSVHDDPRQR
jgi:hypothetical protein